MNDYYSRPWLVSRKYSAQDTVINFGNFKLGGKNPPVIIAGPCAVEGRQQLIDTAKSVKEAGAHILRAGAFKPRSHPYSFQGLGAVGLDYLAEAGELVNMPTESEAVGETYLELVAQKCSIIHIGTRNGKSFELLKKASSIAQQYGKPILLKRGESATIWEFLGAAEYIASQGCLDIILCLRGIRTYENIDNGLKRYTSDIDSIPILKQLTHLPIIFDPSHASGNRSIVPALSYAAILAGADGLMIETHLNPENAMSDAPQQVTPETLAEIIKTIDQLVGCVGKGT
ncbi:3-deoxy-7-phosphoheptulonate synthase [Candidatus Woesearchaeota archaeon]|jgi:3-deoxy-7-phosphoheptulonate synthase|nr:3-deoxy-7-phosphoheptulonate synthase [Candidatus Woesearchaeota archaeon]